VPPTLLIAALLALVLGVRLVPGRHSGALVCDEPSAPWMPLAASAVVVAVIVWIWGGLQAPPAITDEAAYLLQAGLAARGRWSLPTPPDLAAFTQASVLLVPVLAPKMPPGHAILLAPGIWLGLPGLVPVIMIGMTVALFALLARRLYGLGVAVLAIAVWLTLGAQSRWRASYLTETTTTLLWLASWWCLLRWRNTRRMTWLLAVAALCGWGAITRPLTMLMFAIPVGIVVCHDVVRLRLWRQLAAALAVGVVPLLLLPVQNAAITGNWRESPLALYTRQYMPWDRMGFGLDSTPPQFSQGPEARPTAARFEELHREHVPARLPAILRQRLGIAGSSLFGGWRKFLVIPALVGLIALGGSGWFALATGLLLYVGYLVYAHEAHWSVYYAEATPIEALVVAVGLQRVLAWAVGERARSGVAAVVAAAMIMALGFPDLARAAHNREASQRPYRELARQIASQGSQRTLVFVRYGPDDDQDMSLARNVADPDRAAALTVHDRGTADNARVAALLPDRVPYLWDGATRQLLPIRR
jgi:hypothetical protein